MFLRFDFLIHACDGESAPVDRSESIFAELDLGKELLHGFMGRSFFFHCFPGFLRILIVFSGAGDKPFEDAVAKLESHRSVNIDLRS